MTDEEHRLSRAVASFWERVEASSVVDPGQWQQKALVSVEGESSWSGSYMNGEFFASSAVCLKRDDGTVFLWTLGLLFESRNPNQVGGFLQPGTSYGYVAIQAEPKGQFVPIYSIGDVDLLVTPDDFSQPLNLGSFLAEVMALAEKCLRDLEFVYQGNLLPKLSGLVSTAREPLPYNPFKENPNA